MVKKRRKRFTDPKKGFNERDENKTVIKQRGRPKLVLQKAHPCNASHDSNIYLV
jgi:hypothetical protein